jgi:hypothetical protein
VQVRYPLTSEQEHADRAAWPQLPGWVAARGGPDEWEICVQAPDLATWHEGEVWDPVASGAPPRSARPKYRRTWSGLPGPNWRHSEHHTRPARPGLQEFARDGRAGQRRRAPPNPNRPGPRPVLIAMAAWPLALIGGGALSVSFSAQYACIVAVRRQDTASVVETLLEDLLMIVFTLLSACPGRGSLPGPSGP